MSRGLLFLGWGWGWGLVVGGWRLVAVGYGGRTNGPVVPIWELAAQKMFFKFLLHESSKLL